MKNIANNVPVIDSVLGIARGFSPAFKTWYVGNSLTSQPDRAYIFDGQFHEVVLQSIGFRTPHRDIHGEWIFQGDVVRDALTADLMTVVYTEYGNFGLQFLKTKQLETSQKREYFAISPEFAKTGLEIVNNMAGMSHGFLQRYRNFYELNGSEKAAIVMLIEGGMSYAEVSKVFGIQKMTAYEIVKSQNLK